MINGFECVWVDGRKVRRGDEHTGKQASKQASKQAQLQKTGKAVARAPSTGRAYIAEMTAVATKMPRGYDTLAFFTSPANEPIWSKPWKFHSSDDTNTDHWISD